jgi:hypothetical protein
MLTQMTAIVAETRVAEVSLRFREGVTSDGPSGWWFLVVPFLAVIVSWMIYRIADRPRPVVNTREGLLQELCKLHQLPAAGRRLLEQIAEAAELDHPASLFLGQTSFDAAVEKASARVRFGRRQRRLITTLRGQLFAI